MFLKTGPRFPWTTAAKFSLVACLKAAVGLLTHGQSPDTLLLINIDTITVAGQSTNINRLSATKETYIWAGKKSEVINLQYLDANIAEKNPLQIFAKVPGVFVYDMDGGVVARLSLNNVADNQYFTKRPSFYPGPGIWLSDGRSAVLSVGIKI